MSAFGLSPPPSSVDILNVWPRNGRLSATTMGGERGGMVYGALRFGGPTLGGIPDPTCGSGTAIM